MRRRFLLRFVLLFCGGMIALACFLNSSFFNLEKVKIEGNTSLKDEELEALAGPPYGFNLWRLDLEAIQANLLLHPVIKEVRVSRELPRTLVIKVCERQPRALLPTPQGFLEVDAEGVYLRKVASLSPISLPLVTGLNLTSSPLPGKPLSAPYLDQALFLISQLPPEVLRLTSEISFRNPEQIYFYTSTGMPVYWGDLKKVPEKSRLFLVAIEQLEKEARFLDVSSAEAVFLRE